MKIGRLEIKITYHSDKIRFIRFNEFGIWYYLPLMWSIKHYLKNQKKLMAIKLWKYRTGDGLVIAKDKVNEIQNKYSVDSTEEFIEFHKQ